MELKPNLRLSVEIEELTMTFSPVIEGTRYFMRLLRLTYRT